MNRLARRIVTAATGVAAAAAIGGVAIATAGATGTASAPASAAAAAQPQQFAGIYLDPEVVEAPAAPAAPDPEKAGVRMNGDFVGSLPTLKIGHNGEYVLALQVGLKLHGYELDGTGYFGSVTQDSVSDWQRKNGIDATGVVDFRTWESLVGPEITVKPANPQLSPGEAWTNDSCELRGQIAQLGDLLDNATGLNEQSCLDGGSTDVYENTELQVVKNLQKRAGINPSGIIGERTTNAIYVASVLYASNCNCG